MLQQLSYAAQIAGGINLKNPAESFAKFSERVQKTLGKTINNPASKSDFNDPRMFDAFSNRGDPSYDIDWIGMVMDRSNPKALDWSYIQSIQTPSIDIEPNPVFRGGKMSTYAGVLSIGNIDIGLYTDTNAKAIKFASSWVASIYNNETGDYFLPKDYKKDIFVYVLNVNMGTVALFKFFGCFPTSWSSYSLHGGAAAPLVTTLNLTVDSFSVGSDKGESAGSSLSSSAGPFIDP